MRKTVIGLLAALSVMLVLPAAAGATGSRPTKPPAQAQVYVVHGLPLPGQRHRARHARRRLRQRQSAARRLHLRALRRPGVAPCRRLRRPDPDPRRDHHTHRQDRGGALVGQLLARRQLRRRRRHAGHQRVQQRHLTRPWVGLGAIALHHAAAAPAVDVDLGLFPLSRKLPWLKVQAVTAAVNGAQARFVFPTWLAYTADVRVAGTKQIVLSLDDVKVSRNVLTNVYVVGSAAGGTLQAIVTHYPDAVKRPPVVGTPSGPDHGGPVTAVRSRRLRWRPKHP